GRFVFVEHSVDGHDGRVSERRRLARFVENRQAHFGIGDSVESFQRDLALQLFLPRFVNYAESTAAEFSFDPETGDAWRIVALAGARENGGGADSSRPAPRPP